MPEAALADVPAPPLSPTLEGRREQILKTDQDNGLVFASDAPTVRPKRSLASSSRLGGATLVAERHEPIDGVNLGNVGRVTGSNRMLVRTLMTAGVMPRAAAVGAALWAHAAGWGLMPALGVPRNSLR